MKSSRDKKGRHLQQKLARAGLNLRQEFKRPLEQLVVPLQVLLETEENPTKKALLFQALFNASKFHSLTSTLEEIASLELGETRMSFNRGNVMQFISSICQTFNQAAKKKSINIRIQSNPHSLVCLFDLAKLRRVIYTLIANAIKYSEKELSEIVISSRLLDKGNVLSITIVDNGIGIEAQKVPFITDPFYSDPTHLRLYQSTSIGLYLVNRMLEEVGGSISFFSRKGEGTTVEVSYPIYHDIREIPYKNFGLSESINFEAYAFDEITNEINTFEITDLHTSIHEQGSLVFVHTAESTIKPQWLEQLKSNFRIELITNLHKIPEISIEYEPELILLHGDWNDALKAIVQLLKCGTETMQIPVLWVSSKINTDLIKDAVLAGVSATAAEADTEMLIALCQNQIQGQKRIRDYIAHKTITTLHQKKQNLSMDEVFLLKLQHIVRENLHATTVNIQRYCELMNYSRTQLHRKIKAITGYSTSNYIRKYKLELAHDDLIHQRGTVSEIAFKYGFGSSAYFSRVYKLAMGYAPSENKKNRIKKK